MIFNLFEYMLLLVGQANFLGVLQNPEDVKQLNDLLNMGMFEHMTPRKLKNGRPENVLVSIENMNIKQRNSLSLLFDLLSTLDIGIRINRSILKEDLRSFLLDINWVVGDRGLFDRIWAGQLPCFYAELFKWTPGTVDEICID